MVENMNTSAFNAMLRNYNGETSAEEYFKEMAQAENKPEDTVHNSEQSNKDIIGVNLNEEACQGKLGTFIGRNKELNGITRILSRKHKNSLILKGEGGVGKTSIVEGLAKLINSGNVSEQLKNKNIISIDVSSIAAGTSVRGQLEEKVQKIIDEIKKNDNILFIDNIEQIASSNDGSSKSSNNIAELLKPILSRSDFPVIGTTTNTAYRKSIEKDSTLSRLFSIVDIDEPSKGETFEIMKGIVPEYEKYHNVVYDDAIINSMIDYSVRYMADRRLPDKSIDLLDIVGVTVSQENKKAMLDLNQQKADIEVKKNQIITEINTAIETQDFIKANELKCTITELEQEILQLEKNDKKQITVQDVASIVEEETGIPVTDMNEDSIELLKSLENNLNRSVIGQEEASHVLAKAIRRARSGFNNKNRPMGSFLFVGPTGVGKTEITKALAKEIFGSENAMIRFDMSEFSDQSAVSKLIGANAGFVGYDDNDNTLTEKVRQNPYSLILFDEFEKANSKIHTLLLQLLEDGRLTDGQGNTVDFKNTIIIATSNAGAKEMDHNNKLQILSDYFKPELVNRFDSVIKFNDLNDDNLKEILNLILRSNLKTFSEKGIDVQIDEKTKTGLLTDNYDHSFGARPIRRIVEREIVDKVVDKIFDNPKQKAFVVKLNSHNETVIS